MLKTFDPGAYAFDLFLPEGPVQKRTGVTCGESSKLVSMSKRHALALDKSSNGIAFQKELVTREVRLTQSFTLLDLAVLRQITAVALPAQPQNGITDSGIYGTMLIGNTQTKFICVSTKGYIQITLYNCKYNLSRDYAKIVFALYAVQNDPETRAIFDDILLLMTQQNNTNALRDACFQFCDSVLYFFKELKNTTQIGYMSGESEHIFQTALMSIKTGNAKEIDGIVPVREYQDATQTDRNRTDRIKKKKEQEAATAPRQKEEPKEDPLKPYRNGKYIIPYEWSKKQRERIVPVEFLDHFVPVPEFFRLMRKLDFRLREHVLPLIDLELTEPVYIRGNDVNFLLYGNPGTGKTVLAHALSAATGMPLYETKFDRYTESDEIEGKNKIVEGKLTFASTDFLEGYENGGIILMEEINCADQNMLTGTLNNAIEYPSFIMKNGYQKISRHPMTVIIATMNVGTEGTMWLNQAFASRFKQKYRVSDPSPDDFVQFLMKYGYSNYDSKYVYNAYTKIKNALLENRSTSEYALNLSTRACLGALENMEEGDDPKTAISDTLIGAIGIVDPATADELNQHVVANLPNYHPPKAKKGKGV